MSNTVFLGFAHKFDYIQAYTVYKLADPPLVPRIYIALIYVCCFPIKQMCTYRLTKLIPPVKVTITLQDLSYYRNVSPVHVI